VKRLQATEFISAAEGNRLDVVDLPPIFGIGVTMIRESHDRTANVGTPEVRILALNRSALLPDREFRSVVDVFECVCVVHIRSWDLG
jgi:hypothetical protein